MERKETETFVRRTRIAAPVERVFQWHELPGTFENLVPPGEPVKLLSHSGGIRDGARLEIAIGYRPLRMRWIAVHDRYIENRQFRDVQVSGPFRQWEHTHLVEPDGPDACYLEDHIEYVLPFGALGRRLLGGLIRKRLERLFDYRHRVTRKANEA